MRDPRPLAVVGGGRVGRTARGAVSGGILDLRPFGLSFRGQSARTAPLSPPRGRRLLVYGLAAGIVSGSAYEIVTDPPYRREHWPFAPYQMYSRLPGDTWTALRMFGVTAETPSREIPLLDDAYLQPLELVSLANSLDRLDRSADRERLLTAALRDCFDRYETLRRDGRHAGPALKAMRLERLGWRIVSPGRGVLAERHRLFEVASPAEGAP